MAASRKKTDFGKLSILEPGLLRAWNLDWLLSEAAVMFTSAVKMLSARTLGLCLLCRRCLLTGPPPFCNTDNRIIYIKSRVSACEAFLLFFLRHKDLSRSIWLKKISEHVIANAPVSTYQDQPTFNALCTCNIFMIA